MAEPFDRPERRWLKIFAFDPMIAASHDADRSVVRSHRVAIDVANEPLARGPIGDRVQVVDYDGTARRYYRAADLEDADVLKRGSLEPSESDPRFHQQMVYAVTMRTLENFDRALGRRVQWRARQRLRIFPHAFHDTNAYYDPELHALLFGYFRADRSFPGRNLPGQTVFTCLSHDIVAHEATHALIHRLRPSLIEPSNPDSLALHEGFSDIVALFQHLTYPEILESEIQASQTDLRQRSMLAELASQFGYAIGQGRALRSALADEQRKLDPEEIEPHERGSILVAAVFDGFFHTYQRRIRDLVRIATGGTGQLPAGDMHPDLVGRIAREARRTAQQVLTMCIRAFDYLPPVDINFGDYLRGIVTADFDLNPDDENGLRAAMIEAFRARGIFPDDVDSLAQESLLCERGDGLTLRLFEKDLGIEHLESLLADLSGEAAELSQAGSSLPGAQATLTVSPATPSTSIDPEADEINVHLAKFFHAFARDNRTRLGLAEGLSIQVRGFHPVFRVATSGRLNIDWVVQYVQRDPEAGSVELGGIPLRGGTTLVADARGAVRYRIAKPLPDRRGSRALSGALASTRARAERRVSEQLGFVRRCDARDPATRYMTDADYAVRMKRRMTFAALHRGGLQ